MANASMTGGHTQSSAWYTGGANPHQEQAAHSHNQCRSRGPSLRLIGEPDRQHRQQRPAQRESTQDRASDGTLLRRDERGAGEKDSSHQSGGQRAGDDPTNVSPRPRIREGPTVLAMVFGGGFGSHDGLHSMHSPAPHEHSHPHLRHMPSTRHQSFPWSNSSWPTGPSSWPSGAAEPHIKAARPAAGGLSRSRRPRKLAAGTWSEPVEALSAHWVTARIRPPRADSWR
jgi:hypothetical protein